MKKNTFKAVVLVAVAAIANSLNAQTYSWTGASSSDFYSTSNWSSSTPDPVQFVDPPFKTVRVLNAGTAPIINEAVAWQPGIFDVASGSLTVNADFFCFFNDFFNGTITINTGATFTCRNIIRVGRAGQGTVNVNGTLRSNNTDTWQAVFIGVLANGNGTVNVNNGGIVNGGYQVEVGTRDFYPTGVLNINEGGLSEAYWETWIGPNGTINVNGGNLNTGKTFVVGNLFLDNAANTGTIGEVVGRLNVNSGTVTVNHNDLEAPIFTLHEDAKVTIDGGVLRIKRTGVDFSADVNAHITAGRIAPVAGKELVVSYDGVYTTVTAQAIASSETFDKQVFTVYPNPVVDVFTINMADASVNNITITVTDLLGKEVLKTNTGLFGSVNVSGLPSGVYMVKAEAGTMSSIVRIVKQ